MVDSNLHPKRLSAALVDSDPLAKLLAQMRDSKARFDTIRTSLPEALAAHVTPGPLNDREWVLFVTTNSAAAKLRHWLPALQDGTAGQDGSAIAIRVKVQIRR